MALTRSTCPYCGVGCGVLIESEGAHITGVRGDPEHPANFGRLCSKGSTLHLTASAAVTQQTRLLQPMQRLQRGAAPVPLPWDAALDLAAQRFAETIQAHGADSVGFYVSGQLLTEDYYVYNKLVKGLIGSNNIDTNSRLCMSSAVAGYKKTLGADAPPACYEDLGLAHTLFIVGSNTAFAHPILYRRIEDARRSNPQLKIIVVDPRRTDTADGADLHLAIQPGTDVMLFHGMLYLLLWEGWTDNAYIAAHTSGFDALRQCVRDYTPDLVSQTCGISKESLLQATRWFAGVDADGARAPTLSLYCQGLNQSSSGTDKNMALINLHLATGQIGKPGAGPFSLTGQPNAMGGREVGGLATALSAHRDLDNPMHRAEVAALWGVQQVPAHPGKTAVEMFQAAADGEIRALWIACTNPAQSMPDQTTVRAALARADFVVVQEAFASSATCDWADLLLPATTWGEKEGTVTNSERRISRVRAAVAAPSVNSEAPRHDWAIGVAFARRLEHALGRDGNTLFPYTSPESIWNEHRESTRGRDLDITGLSYALLEQAPRQWPCVPAGDAAGEATRGTARLYTDGVFATSDGRARFATLAYRPVAEARDAHYPFALNTGRLRDQWHGMTRTGTLPRLYGHAPEPVLHMHAQDMARRQLVNGELVHLASRRGSIVLPIAASAEMASGQVFLPMHWGEESLSGRDAGGAARTGVNAVTNPALCPASKQPEFKHSAVHIRKAALPWSLLAMAWLPADQVLAAQRSMRALFAEFEFASCVLFGNATALGDTAAARCGLQLRAAHRQPVADEVLAQIESTLALHGADTLRYVDRQRGQHRAVRLLRGTADAATGQQAGDAQDAPVLLQGFLLAGDTSAQHWVSALLLQGQPAQQFGRALLLASPTPPHALQAQGTVVCTCFNVTDTAIAAQLQQSSGTASERLAALQAALRCGSNCGSCLPQVQRQVRAHTEALAAPT